MEYISQSNTRKFENGAIVAWEYEMQNTNLNVACISIKGRYPENGFTRNLQSDSIVHIVNGNGIVGIRGGTTTDLTADDQIHLAIGDAYYFEGDLEIIYAASPAWTSEQTEHTD